VNNSVKDTNRWISNTQQLIWLMTKQSTVFKLSSRSLSIWILG